MSGAYCRYCDQRCFVGRVMPRDAVWMPGQWVHLATCTGGMRHDRETTGYDYITAERARRLDRSGPPPRGVSAEQAG